MNRNNIKYIGIGGTGGSGTRLVAQICKEAGVFIGDNINKSNDNLLYPKLLKLVYLNDESDKNKTIIATNEINKFVDNLFSEYETQREMYNYCGWKAPGTFFGLEYFHKCLPNMLYIHVVRNGFDMAFSKNQNQLKAWSSFLNIDLSSLNLPNAALEYWIKANEIAFNNCLKYFKNAFLIVEFDQLCKHPLTEIKKLLEFIKCDTFDIEKLVSLVKSPPTINRHKTNNNYDVFSQKEINRVNKLTHYFRGLQGF